MLIDTLCIFINIHIDNVPNLKQNIQNFKVKHVQKSSVRSIAMKYESLTKAPQQRFSLTKHQNSLSAADEAQALIAASKRQRAGTMPPKNNKGITSSVYQPPRFADQCITTSKQFQNRKNKKNAIRKGAQSTPVSPKYGCDDKDSDGPSPPSGPLLQNASKSLAAKKQKKSFKTRKRGKGKAGKRRRVLYCSFLAYFMNKFK